MGRPGFEADDILIWGGLLAFVTVLIGLALMKLVKTRHLEVEPGTPPMLVRWGIPVVVLAAFWVLTFYRCFLWWKYG